jgi:hypothetical protein
LQAGLFTRDARRIFEAYEQLEVGSLVGWRLRQLQHRADALWRQ